jgi:hypothetical protein
MDIVRGNVLEAPDDGLGGPRWVCHLDDGTTVVGRPSWMTSGTTIALPNIQVGANQAPVTDWARLMAKCQDEGRRVVKIGLWVPPHGLVAQSDDGAPAYGYFEAQIAELAGPDSRMGVTAVAICWPERRGKGWVVQNRYVFADGRYEGWVSPGSWLPCMIGEREHDLMTKDGLAGRT